MKTALSLSLLMLVALSACESGGGSIEDPQYGKEVCAECGSTLKEPSYAALAQAADGSRRVFDDPGCLFKSLRSGASEGAKLYFHQHDGPRWLSGTDVTFASTPQTKSPQGYDWAAFASFGDAQTAVTSAGSGEILSFEQAKEGIGAGKP